MAEAIVTPATQPLPDNGLPPKDVDLPATIVVYVLVILLGIGMCFCLRRANRLIPNRFSFPLSLRNNGADDDRRQGGYNVDEELGDPESRQGLLSHYDEEEEEDTRYLTSRRSVASEDEETPLPHDNRPEDFAREEEEFGALQGEEIPKATEFDIGASESEEEAEPTDQQAKEPNLDGHTKSPNAAE